MEYIPTPYKKGLVGAGCTCFKNHGRIAWIERKKDEGVTVVSLTI